MLGVSQVYNIQNGGNNKEISKETRNKISISNKGRISPFLNKTHTDENKNIMSIKMTEKFKTQTHHLKGRIRSNEEKIKISKAQRKLSDEDELNIQNEYVSGKYSHRSLATKYNVSKYVIGFIINNKRRKL